MLMDGGIIMRIRSAQPADAAALLEIYAPYVEQGLFVLKEFVNDKTGYTDTQTMLTPKGKETFRLLCI